jgi:hypothetical protein
VAYSERDRAPLPRTFARAWVLPGRRSFRPRHSPGAQYGEIAEDILNASDDLLQEQRQHAACNATCGISNTGAIELDSHQVGIDRHAIGIGSRLGSRVDPDVSSRALLLAWADGR